MRKGLDVASEFGAFREQIYVYEEIRAKLSADRLAALQKNERWQQLTFLADLWEDKILDRYPTKEAFVARYWGDDYPDRAALAYQHLLLRAVEPGSPHLDFHILDVYKKLSDERDIRTTVLGQIHKRGYSLAQSKSDAEVLNDRFSLLQRINETDEGFRKTHGFELSGSIK